MASNNDTLVNMLMLTDCLYFTNGICQYKNKCRYRHCEEAVQQFNKCVQWPYSCRNVACPYRHPRVVPKSDDKVSLGVEALVNHPVQPPLSSKNQQGFVSFFWDIENVAIPKDQQPFDIVQRIRQKLVTDRGLQEASFSCYCDSVSIPVEKQRSLSEATVRIVHVPDRKPGAIDRQILLDLDRFERTHRAPATIVLISGDIDFIGKLSDLRHHVGFYIIVIHNKVAKEQLKATVNEHYPWELFTNSSDKNSQLVNKTEEQKSNKSTRKHQPINNNGITNSDTVKHNQIPIKCLMELPKENRFAPNTPDRLRPMNRQRGSANKPIKPLMSIPVDSASADISDNDTSSIKDISTTAPRSRLRSASSATRLNLQKRSFFTSHESIPAVVNKNKDGKIKSTQPALFSCPHCTNEYDTIKALHQHQRDKKHLLDCSECNEGFLSVVSLKQHQTAKKHNGSKDEPEVFDLPESNSTIPKPKKRNRSRKKLLKNENETNIAAVSTDED